MEESSASQNQATKCSIKYIRACWIFKVMLEVKAYTAQSIVNLLRLTTPLLLLLLLQIVMQPVSAAGTTELSLEQKAHIHQLPSIKPVATDSENDLAESGADSISLEDRVVVVTFFASWCPPCLDEFRALNAVKRKLGEDNLTIVALNVFEAFDDNDDVRMAKFLDNTQPEFHVLEGNVESRELFGGINRIPTLFVYDRAGKLVFDFVHKRGATKQSAEVSELMEAIQPLI